MTYWSCRWSSIIERIRRIDNGFRRRRRWATFRTEARPLSLHSTAQGKMFSTTTTAVSRSSTGKMTSLKRFTLNSACLSYTFTNLLAWQYWAGLVVQSDWHFLNFSPDEGQTLDRPLSSVYRLFPFLRHVLFDRYDECECRYLEPHRNWPRFLSMECPSHELIQTKVRPSRSAENQSPTGDISSNENQHITLFEVVDHLTTIELCHITVNQANWKEWRSLDGIEPLPFLYRWIHFLWDS